MTTLKVVLIKPSKYGDDGYIERFKAGYMSNATLYHIAGLTPNRINSNKIITHTIDEYVWDNLDYYELLKPDPDPNCITLVAIVGVQSHQFHRALDLAAYSHNNGIKHCIIGGPHPMTCDTTQFHNRGVSFALAEAEIIWNEIIRDAIDGELKPIYGLGNRWAETIDGPIVFPPASRDIERYLIPLLGLYPVRGCPYNCNYCSVIKISGQQIRSTPVECTLESLRLAKEAGIEYIMFVSDNFNKYPEAHILLEKMIKRNLTIPFLCQCDTQIARQPEFVELLGRAGCYEMFVGVESFNKTALKETNKFHNKPDSYGKIIEYCRNANIQSHFANIIGFPSDTEESIKEQSTMLQRLNPTLSSFNILTPIPGTEQYKNYMADNLLTENNLDRIDGTCLTWRHPNITSDKMTELLFQCFMDCCNASLKYGHLSKNAKAMVLAFRHYSKQRMHPMAGGTGKKRLDKVSDYIDLRKKYFNIELAPLPTNLELSPKHEARSRDNRLITDF